MQKETKFCLSTDEKNPSVEIVGTGASLAALIASAIHQDPRIREIITTALIAVISHDMIGEMEKDRGDSLEEMLKKMNVGLA